MFDARLTNPLLFAAANLALCVISFFFFFFPWFTGWGFWTGRLVLLVLLVTVALSVRGLWKRSFRGGALGALLLCVPVVLFFMFLMVWEGPLYASVGKAGDFHVRGLADFCGLGIYGPEHDNPEWFSDDVGLIWSFEWTGQESRFCPPQTHFSYGRAPSGFRQTTPADGVTPPPLDPNLKYTLVLNRGAGGPQNLTLRGWALSEYTTNSEVCWGQIPVPGRDPAMVRIDCTNHKPLPMSQRAQARLKAYQEKRIVFY